MMAIEAGFSRGGARGSGALASYGPTLMVQVGFDREFAAGGAISLPDERRAALVDTGARLSCIDTELAMELRLPIVDRGMVTGVHGTMDLNLHSAQIHVPDLEFTLNGRFYGVHLSSGTRPHSVLIGRDFLQRFTMVYNGKTGSVTISEN